MSNNKEGVGTASHVGDYKNDVFVSDEFYQSENNVERDAVRSPIGDNETDCDVNGSKQAPEKKAIKRARHDEYDLEKASKNFESDDFRKLEKNAVMEVGDRFEDSSENSDKEGSDNEIDSDVSTSTSDNSYKKACRSQFRKGSYDFVCDEVNVPNNVCDEAARTDSEAEFDSAEESSSLSVSESEEDSSTAEDKNMPQSDAVIISAVGTKNKMVNEYNQLKTVSFGRSCFYDGSLCEIPSDQHFNVDYTDPESYTDELQYRDQLDSVDDADRPIDENDPHSLIRKPAVRRKGFSWVSRSLPNDSRTDRRRRKQKEQDIDSSLDLGPSLLKIYDHRVATRTEGDDDNDYDENDLVIGAGTPARSKSLPARVDGEAVDRDSYYMHKTSPQTQPLGQPLSLVDDESIPMVVGSLDDTKKRPLSGSSASSNSFTYSPRIRKKRGVRVIGDGNTDYLEDLQISDETVAPDSISVVSSSASSHTMDSDFAQKTKDGDKHLDNMSITSSENGSLEDESKSNIERNYSATSSSSSNRIDSSQAHKPLHESNNKYINSKEYNNNNTTVPVAFNSAPSNHGQPDLPVPSPEFVNSLPNSQSPAKRPHPQANKEDNLRHSSSSSSRHEARMKFFTNYEEYMNQPSTPLDATTKGNDFLSSEYQPKSSRANSSIPSSQIAIKDNSRNSPRPSSQLNTSSSTPAALNTFEGGRDKSKISRNSERASRRSERRSSASKQDGFSRSGFSRSSKKRDLAASSDPANRLSQGYASYVSRVVAEIIESERTYIASLEDIINGYLEPMEQMLNSKEAKKDIECLFSNIKDIYKFGCTFLADLEVAGTDCVKVAQCFVRHNKGFVIYTDYCTNYPRAVEVLTRFMQHPELSELCKERQIALGHGLPLGAYLLKPVQRILKYHLLLNNIVKSCEKEKEEVGIIEQAFHHMTEMAHHINEMKRKHEHAVRIQEIQSQLEDYVGEDLTRLGELVLEGTFKVYGAKASRQVFLFERGLLICKKNEGGMLSCKAFILCSNLMLVEVIPNEPLSFHIIPFDNPRAQYTLQARNMEQKKLWCQNIKELILESFKGRIPDNVKNLIMQLGREHDDDYVSKEAMEAGRKNQHTAPEYLEKRRFRGKSGPRIPDFSLLRPQKAKRGGNKKGDMRVEQKMSPERARRAKSKSPERQRHIFLKQNVATKGRSLSSNSPTTALPASPESIPNSIHAITQAVAKVAGYATATSVGTSPESPVLRKSPKFTYSKNEKEETVEIPKRPLSFLMARANPILSADLTQLLARCGGSIKLQSPTLKESEGHDRERHSHTNVDDFNETSLSKLSTVINSSDGKHQSSIEGDIWGNDNKSKDSSAVLMERDISEVSNSFEDDSAFLENDASLQSYSNQNIKESRRTGSKSTSSLTLKMLAKYADECDEDDEGSIAENMGNYESAAYMYPTVNISEVSRGHMDTADQNLGNRREAPVSREHEIGTSKTDRNVADTHDISSKTATENVLKKKGLRLPNTSKHLLAHEYVPDVINEGSKAKLTNWNSVDKLTEGSMDDLSHLEDDPWVKNTEVSSSERNTDAESPISSRHQGHYDVTEMMQVSNNKENMDWIVYQNRNSLKNQPLVPEMRMSTSALDKYSAVPKNTSTETKLPSQSSFVTPPREYMTYENMKKLGLIKDNNRGESFKRNNSGKNYSSVSSRKVNAFGMSPTTVTIARPVSFTSDGLVRSSSMPISNIEDNYVRKVFSKTRPVSLDIERLTGEDNRIVNEMKEYTSHSSENIKDTNKFPTILPSIRVEEEADSNRLSVISSVSTSSYESESSSSSDGLVDTLKSKLHAWSKNSRSRDTSDVSCTSTLTSDDENKDALPKFGNTFEPSSTNRNSWKEDRQLETVLREHSLGSSKLGSRMAHSITQPADQVSIHHCSDSSANDSNSRSIQSSASFNKTSEHSEKLPPEKTISPDQAQFSLPTTDTTEVLMPPSLTNCDSQQFSSGVSPINNLNTSDPAPPKPVKKTVVGAALELSDELSKEGSVKSNPKIDKTKTTTESSNLERTDSTGSLGSSNSCYERKLSAAFDSDFFQEKLETDKPYERTIRESLLVKKSIREYVKDIEEKFKAQSPKVFEVKRREPGTMIRQRLQTLRESALHGWRNLSTSSSTSDEKPSLLSNHNIETVTLRKHRPSDSSSKSICLKPSISRDSLSKSFENLSKSRDNVFMSKSRDSLSSMSRSRESLNSLVDSTGYRNSAPVFSLKTTNSGHEKDANRFSYRLPEQNKTLLGNQFIHRAYSISQQSLLESETRLSLDEEAGSKQASKIMYKMNEPGSETENLVVMKGWVKSLISKFQVQS